MFPFPNPGFSATRDLSAFNPSDKDASVTLSNANRTMASAVNGQAVRALNSRVTGKFYCEFVCDSIGGASAWVGFTSGASRQPGNSGQPGMGYVNNGGIFVNASTVTTVATYTAGDRLGFAFDTVAGVGWVSKNGVWQFGNPAAGTGGLSYGATGVAMYAAAYVNVAPGQFSIPATSFYLPPSSFLTF